MTDRWTDGRPTNGHLVAKPGICFAIGAAT